MSTGTDDELVLTPPARRALTDELPESVAAAVIDLLTTAIVQEPRRVGMPLRGQLEGVWVARRGTYRILFRIIATRREVVVLRIDHRRNVNRPLQPAIDNAAAKSPSRQSH